MSTTLLMAFALMLVLEGLMPFLAPGTWRETVRRIAEMSEPTFANVDRILDSGVNPSYALPSWQAAMAMALSSAR